MHSTSGIGLGPLLYRTNAASVANRGVLCHVRCLSLSRVVVYMIGASRADRRRVIANAPVNC